MAEYAESSVLLMVFEICRREIRPATVSVMVDRNSSDGRFGRYNMTAVYERQICPSENFEDVCSFCLRLRYAWDRTSLRCFWR